jgi:hypothetical protein
LIILPHESPQISDWNLDHYTMSHHKLVTVYLDHYTMSHHKLATVSLDSYTMSHHKLVTVSLDHYTIWVTTNVWPTYHTIWVTKIVTVSCFTYFTILNSRNFQDGGAHGARSVETVYLVLYIWVTTHCDQLMNPYESPQNCD